MEPARIANRIQVLLDREQITQAELARRLGVPRNTLHNWLAGRCQPQTAALRLIELLERTLQKLPPPGGKQSQKKSDD